MCRGEKLSGHPKVAYAQIKMKKGNIQIYPRPHENLSGFGSISEHANCMKTNFLNDILELSQ